jgi:hypothetical protein
MIIPEKNLEYNKQIYDTLYRLVNKIDSIKEKYLVIGGLALIGKIIKNLKNYSSRYNFC